MKKIIIKELQKAKKKDGSLVAGNHPDGKEWFLINVLDAYDNKYSCFNSKIPAWLAERYNKGERMIECLIDATEGKYGLSIKKIHPVDEPKAIKDSFSYTKELEKDVEELFQRIKSLEDKLR